MVKRTKGARMGTSNKLTRRNRDKGKISLRRHLQILSPGDNVQIKVDSSFQKGMPFRRFLNKHGVIVEKRGRAYVVEVREGHAHKRVVCAPVHLRKM